MTDEQIQIKALTALVRELQRELEAERIAHDVTMKALQGAGDE